MAYITDEKYYDNDGTPPTDTNWGSYQYVALKDVVNNFSMMYTGQDKLLDNVQRHQIIYHAKRAIQELNYDALKEIKVLELNIDDSLRFVLPYDYVNWVRVSLYRDGVLVPIDVNTNNIYAKSYVQATDGSLTFDGSGYVVEEDSQIDTDRLDGNINSTGIEKFNDQGLKGYKIDNDYGLRNDNGSKVPSFSISRAGGTINFSSGLESELCILEYVSDGMERGDDTNVSVNKLFEAYIYAEIKYQLLSQRVGVQEYVVKRSKDERTALMRNARIRIGIHPNRLLRKLRG